MSLEKLKKLVDTLDLSPLDRFQQKRRRRVGRKGNKMSSYAKAWLLRHILGIPSEAQLARKVQTELRRICSFLQAPCKSSYCRARKRLGLLGIEFLFCLLVQKAKELGLATGRIVAVDSTDFEAYCNGRKKLKDRSDKDARWGYSATKGRNFGYKLHLFCDAETELPLAALVLPASRHDAFAFFPLFDKLLRLFSAIWKLLADCGYDALEIRKRIGGMKAAIARNGRGKFESENPKDPDYKKRTAIERLNSRIKGELGLDNLKMRGLWAATFHATEVLCSMLYAAVGSFLAGFENWRSIVNLRD